MGAVRSASPGKIGALLGDTEPTLGRISNNLTLEVAVIEPLVAV